MLIHDDVDSFRSSEPWYDPEKGAGWLWLAAHAALTAKTPYARSWNATGMVTLAVPSTATFRFLLVFPHNAVASGAADKMQFAGKIDAVVTPSLSMTAGHAFTVAAGAIADNGAAPTGATDEFAVAEDTTSTATSHDMLLFGTMVTHP